VPKSLSIRVASPCSERWADMRPRGDGRHCERCEKTVVDLSRMTRGQAEALVRSRTGELCVRIAEDDRGQLVFRAEPKRLPVLGPMALAGLLAACASPPSAEPVVADETEEALEPDLGESDGAGLDASSASFGGSLATGVMMPMAPTHAEPTLVPPPSDWGYARGVQGPGSDGTPTPEQVSLTRRKQRQRRQQQVPPTSGPIIHHTMGVMACPIDP
jgi:hypothetical protein